MAGRKNESLPINSPGGSPVLLRLKSAAFGSFGIFGILVCCSNINFVQRAIIACVTMVFALRDGAPYACVGLVSISCHSSHLSLIMRSEAEHIRDWF